MKKLSALVPGILFGLAGCGQVGGTTVGAETQASGNGEQSLYRCSAYCTANGKTKKVRWRDCSVGKDAEDTAEADAAQACKHWKANAVVTNTPRESQCVNIRHPKRHQHDCQLENGGGWGDPHMTTFDGMHYELQPLGEFVYATDNQTYSIQMRTEQYYGTLATLQTAIATKFQDGTTVGIYARTTPTLMVNGVAAVLDCVNDVQVPNGQLCTGALELDNGAWIEYDANARKFTVNFADEISHIDVTIGSAGLNYLNTQFFIGPAIKDNTVGVLGTSDGNAANDYMTRDGVTLANPSFNDLYGKFTNSWRISDQESLMSYLPGKSVATFTDLAFPKAPFTSADLPADQQVQARALCQAGGVPQDQLDACAMDAALLGGNAVQDFVHIGLY